MEQWDTSASKSPSSKHHGSETPPASASTSTSPPSSPKTPLASSEPTLRFPRPVGSRHLAQWISTSNPDIMRLTTTTEDTGLAESTYELITGTDDESQDGNYTESVSESIGSLDAQRSDDVRSIADTEQMDDDDVVNASPDLVTTPEPVEPIPHLGDADAELHDEPTPSQEDDDDQGPDSRSSVDYTHESLGTPSLMTPEASRLLELTPDQLPSSAAEGPLVVLGRSANQGDRERWPRSLSNSVRYAYEEARKAIRDMGERALRVGSRVRGVTADDLALLPLLITTVMFFLTVITLSPTLYQLATTGTLRPLGVGDLPSVEYTSPSVLPSSKVSSAEPTPSMFAGGVGLIPVQDTQVNTWLRGSVASRVSFSTTKKNDVLIYVPEDLKVLWVTKDCMTVTAKRDSDTVALTTSFVKDGVLLKFPRKEAHGVIDVTLSVTCRPKFQKVVRVHFGKAIMGEVYGMTKHLAQDLTVLVPAAAQEAERRLEGARHWLDGSGSLMQAARMWYDEADRRLSDLFNRRPLIAKSIFQEFTLYRDALAARMFEAHQTLTPYKIGVTKFFNETAEKASNHMPSFVGQWKEHFSSTQDIREALPLHLLEAQVAARTWWLKVTNRAEEHVEYKRKSQQLLEKTRKRIREARLQREAAGREVAPAWHWPGFRR